MTIQHYEPTVELATIEPGQNLITWAKALGSAHQIASALCTTAFVPKHFAGKPEEAAAALMLGDELGLAPVSALRSIFVIGGTPGMYARTMTALVQSRGHDVWTEVDTPIRVVVCGRRAGSDKVERSEWTIERARRAGYTSNKKYETDPQAMLYARACSDVCRRIAADVLTGIPYTVEELELTEAERPVRKTSRKVEAPKPPEPELDDSPVVTVEQVERPEPPLDESPLLNTRGSLAKAMFAALGSIGVNEKDDRLAYCELVIGRPVESSAELTDQDARDIIAAVEAGIALPAEVTE